MVSFHAPNGLIWVAETEEAELQKVFTAIYFYFPPLVLVTRTPLGKWETVAPMLAACVFKEPREEGVFTRAAALTRTQHALPGAEALLRFATPAPLQRMR